MWLRIIKKKYIIWSIIAIILLYGIVNLINHLKENKSVESIEESVTRQALQFKWYLEGNETEIRQNCRNSVQGKIIIADDQGFLCKRPNVQVSGCCKIDSPSTKRYSCETCKSNDCCSIFENCISCCMNPQKKELLEKSLTKVLDRNKVLIGSINDQFELCLVKCRTSSQMSEIKTSKEWEKAKSLILEPLTPMYDASWLNDCCKKLYQPGSHLEKIISKILSELAPKIRTHGSYSNGNLRKQRTYSLMGLRYVSDKLSDAENYDPTFLEKLSKEESETLDEECKALIIENAIRVKESLGYSDNLSRYSPETPLGMFLKDSGTVFREGVEQQLRDGKKLKIKMSTKEKSQKKFSFDGQGVEVWGSKNDILAQALVEVTQHESNKVLDLLRTFREIQLPLPAPVSNLLKKQFLLRKEKLNFAPGTNLKVIESKWRDEFVKRVHHNTTALNIDRAIKSPLWQEIDKAVIEIYGRVPSLVQYDTEDHQIEATRALNILQIYNKTFDPILVFWLFPVQINFKSSIQSTDSHVMQLAMYLDLINRHCLPSIPSIFEMALEVANTWKDWDRNLFSHIQESLKKNIWIDIKDFPSQILHLDRSQANRVSVKMKGRSRNDIPNDCMEVFVDPKLFIRKWIIEGFAGILNNNVLLYAWDQLFFGEWNSQTICDVCLTLLFLMTDRFSKAKNYFGIREVFLLEPSNLFSADIRKAYIQVQRGNSFDDIPLMNHRTPLNKTDRVDNSN